ncbi:hypothetical protein [Thermococcus sp.]
MDNPASVISDTVGEVLVGAIIGVVVSAVYAVMLSTLEFSFMMKVLFVGIFAMVDIVGLFETAAEGLTAPMSYLIFRFAGYALAIMLLLEAGLPATMAFINLLILLIASVIRIKYE